MKRLAKPNRNTLVFYWTFPLLLALLVSLLSKFSVLEKLEFRLLDARFKIRGAHPIDNSPFQVVAVDDQTFSSLDRKWPFPGSFYAHFINNLNRAGAKLIVFDIQFSELNQLHPQEDSIFADAVRRAGNVILAGKVAYSYSQHLKKPFDVLVQPIPPLLKTRAPWGIINELTDSDDFTRRYLLYLPYENTQKLSLGLEVLRSIYQIPDTVHFSYQNGVGFFGKLRIPMFDHRSMMINYYGPTSTFPAISFSSVLDDSSFELVHRQDSNYMENFIQASGSLKSSEIQNPFKDKVILVGVSVEEMHDNKNTPFYDYLKTPRKMPGIEVHANALQTIIDHTFIHRTPFIWTILINLVIAYLVFLVAIRHKPIFGLGNCLAIMFAVVFSAIYLFNRNNIWIDVLSPINTISLGYVSSLAYNYVQELREKNLIRDIFSHYVPDKLVNQLIENPDLLKLGGERRNLTIMFADVAGFTSISEQLSPEDLVELLNEFLTSMTDIILKHDGIIDKYEGDLIMAEFGAPIPFQDHAMKACRTALDMQDKLVHMRRTWKMQGKPQLSVRIGVHTGDVIVGNMGSKKVFDYTVLGDAVNLSSRLEGANKLFNTGILISRSTKEQLSEEFISTFQP